MSSVRLLEKLRQLFSRSRVQPQKAVRRLRLVQLEDRRLLNGSLSLAAGITLTGAAGGAETLTVSDSGDVNVGSGLEQTFQLTLTEGVWADPLLSGFNINDFNLDGTNKILTVNADIFAENGSVLTAMNVLQIQGTPGSSVQVVINLDDANSPDLLASFDFIPTGGIAFAGGEGANDNDSLTVSGYNIDTLTLSHLGPENGTIGLDG